MSFWDRLEQYRRKGPTAVGELVLRPAKEFNAVVSNLSDEVLGPLGWSRGRGLWWSWKITPWADKVIELQAMRGGLGARWGLSLSFVPRVGRIRSPILHLSYNPCDYQRDISSWTLSQFSTDQELHADVPVLLRRAHDGAALLDDCCVNHFALSRCFQRKRERKAVRLAFRQYPMEVISYAALLGLLGRREEALQMLDDEETFDRLEVSIAGRERWLQELQDLWDGSRPAAE